MSASCRQYRAIVRALFRHEASTRATPDNHSHVTSLEANGHDDEKKCTAVLVRSPHDAFTICPRDHDRVSRFFDNIPGNHVCFIVDFKQFDIKLSSSMHDHAFIFTST
jgi:hypothetical protein